MAGSYSSAEAILELPTTKTLPLVSSVAVWSKRATVMLPVEEKVPVAGSYSSAEKVPPPATKTLTLVSSVAVWLERVVLMLPVEEKVPVTGS